MCMTWDKLQVRKATSHELPALQAAVPSLELTWVPRCFVGVKGAVSPVQHIPNNDYLFR